MSNTATHQTAAQKFVSIIDREFPAILHEAVELETKQYRDESESLKAHVNEINEHGITERQEHSRVTTALASDKASLQGQIIELRKTIATMQATANERETLIAAQSKTIANAVPTPSPEIKE